MTIDLSGDLSNLRETFQGLMPLLDAYGVDARNVRRQAYLRFLEDWKADRLSSYDQAEVVRLMRELHEVVFVLDTLATNKIAVPNKLIRASFEGHPTPLNDPESDRSRNYILELRVAIYFLRLGYTVLLDQDCDVVAEREGRRFFIECKRLYSENKVHDRTKEAFVQVLRRLASAEKGKQDRAIVWVDPSPIILKYCPFYMAATKVAALQAARYDLLEFQRRYLPRPRLPQDRRVIALILQMVWPSRCSLDQAINTGFTALVTPGHENLSGTDAIFVRKLFDQLFELDEA